MKNIIDAAAEAGTFTTLLSALQAAALTDSLRAAGPFTLFAPTDDAFKRLPAGTVEALLKDVPKLKSLLTLHVVPAAHALKDIQAGSVKSLQGESLTITMPGNEVQVNGAKVIRADIAASNGVIHAINAVIMAKPAALAAVA